MQDNTSHKSVNNEDSSADSQRKELIAQYEALPAEERRQRMLVLPDYADRREEMIQPERVVQQFRYFWDNWVPKIGPVPSMVYMKLRQYAYYNRRSGELREDISHVFPKQSTLAASIGVRNRKTIMDALKTLETYGLIRRKAKSRWSDKHQHTVRTSDHYFVKILDILTPEHQVGLLMEETLSSTDKPHQTKEKPDKSEKRTYRISDRLDVENSVEESEKRTFPSGPKNGQLKRVPLERTKNVKTFEKPVRKDGQIPLATDPRIRALDSAERGDRERMVDLVDEVLKKVEDNYSVEPHRNYGLHKRFAMLLPTTRVQEALAATQDVVQRERAGDVSLRKSPAHYFAGVCRNIAVEEGIDLGIKWRSERPDDAVDDATSSR